jgi:chemotaxis methyl-accepting protein methylase
MDSNQKDDFLLLLSKIKKKLGVDFSEYRLPCLKRRIDSRVRVNHLKNYREYAEHLEHNAMERDQLIKTITIHQTEFFRDKPAWEVLQKKIIPMILQQKEAHKERRINVWSAGSSSGEEAYTLAILFSTILDQQLNHFSLKIYGTDIDKDSLEKAKIGSYSAKNMRFISSKILKNYFYFDGKDYQINETIRRLTKFQYDDLINPNLNIPMDLILCRNVLIYFNRQLQMNILEQFSKLLKEDGFLMLGKTESILCHSQTNFKVFDTKERIYQKIG